MCELCYWEDSAAFHTVAFGATAVVGIDPAFMEIQQSALLQVIVQAYPTLGSDQRTPQREALVQGPLSGQESRPSVVVV